MTDPATPTPFRVVSAKPESEDVASFTVQGPANWPAGAPGQFMMLTAFGVGEAAISISGDGARPGVFEHTVRAVGPVTRALAALRPGDVVGLRGPFGKGWPLAEIAGGDVLLVAGGIGLAPLRPVLRRIAARRESFGRVSVLYGARRPRDLLYQTELAALRDKADIQLRITVDRAPTDWRGRVGFVTDHLEGVSPRPEAASAILCGPELMMRFTADALIRTGLPTERIWVSMERNMNCGVGLCGHCQVGPALLCRDGPTLSYPTARPLMLRQEL